MRSLTAAKLLLLDADQARRDGLIRSLSQFGAFEISGIATVAEAANAVTFMPPDLIVIAGPGLAANDEDEGVSPNPFLTRNVPTILLLPDATTVHRRRAARAGYTIVLGAPVPPRLLYRRIAQLLQNARRAKRRAEAAVQESRNAAPKQNLALREAPLLAEVPAS